MSLTIQHCIRPLALLLLSGVSAQAWAITYTINPTGTVTDSNGLTWDRCSYGQTGTNCAGGSATTYTWGNSLGPATVANRGAGYKGHTDWRLPSAAELCTIAFFNGQEGCVGNNSGSATPPKINTTVFPNTQPNAYWTGQESPSVALGSFSVDFRWATKTPYPPENLFNIRLVRGGQAFNPFPGVQPTVIAASRSSATLSVTNTQSSYLFVSYIVVPNESTPPHPGQIYTLENYDGVTVVGRGILQMVPYTSQNATISNLLAETSYSVYFAAKMPNGTILETTQYPAPLNVLGPINFTTYNRVPQAIDFPAQSEQNFGASFRIDPLATGGASPFPVTYSSTTPNVCNYSFPFVNPVGVGTCTIAADQAGNGIYAPAPQVTRDITINRGIQTVRFTSSPPNPARIGPVAYAVSASSDRDLSPINYSIDASSSNVCTNNFHVVTFIGVGSCRITASEAGNSYYEAAQAQQDVVVDKALSDTAVTASISTSTPGQSVTLTARVYGANPTGTTTFIVNDSTTLCKALALTGSQPATVDCVTSSLPIGENTITATYNGNATNAPSTSKALAHVVARRSTTTMLSTSCMRTFVENQPFTLSAIVTGSNPSGSMNFYSGPNSLCADVAISSGGASCTTSALTVPSGTPEYVHSLTASYGGDATHANSTSSPMLITVLGLSNVIFRDGMELPSVPCPIM